MVFIWHPWAAKTENTYKGTKKTRNRTYFDQGNPNLECANSGKSTPNVYPEEDFF